MRSPLSDATIRAMQPPAKGYRILWDSLPGFGCRISQAGTRAFVVLVASGRPATIGRYPAWSLAAARAEAKKRLAHKTLGKITPTHTAFDDAKSQFLALCETRNRPRTVSDYRRLLKHYPFGRQSVADITPRQILQQLAPLPPSEKHHAYAAAKIFFRHCVQHHLIDRTPMENMASVPPGRPRTRVLAEHELRAVYRTARAGTSTFHAIVAILVLTGQRRGEIARLEWDWIGSDMITFPASVTKNGREHAFPYGESTAAILAAVPRLSDTYVFPAARHRTARTTVFNGWGTPKARFDRECGITGWTLHDLRRTYSTIHAQLGTPQIVVEKLLNHVSGGSLSPIAQVYNVHRYEAEMREAALTFERWLTSL